MLKHGDISDLGMVFWGYDSGRIARWLDPIKYMFRKEQALKRSKRSYWKNPEESRSKLRTWHNANKDKKAISFKNWASKNKQKLRGNRLQKTYGVSNEWYANKAKEQGYKCAICNTFQDEKRLLCVDHCHTTGKVRGLLCTKCNAGLGQFMDNQDNLKSAISYLENDRSVQQYQFQMQQTQNAQIGKIGTAPAQVGQTQTQGMQQA